MQPLYCKTQQATITRQAFPRLMSTTHLSTEDKEFLIDFAKRGGVALVPTVTNIRKIVVELARAVFINTPMHSMTKIKEGTLQVRDSAK